MQGNCPSCNRVYDISEEFLAMGGKAKCPHCMEELEFKDASNQAAAPDPRREQTRIDPNRKNAQTRVEAEEVDARCGSCDRRYKIDTQYLRMGGQAKCPHCSLDLIFDVPQQAPPPKEPEEDLWAEVTGQTGELGADGERGVAEGDEGYDEGDGEEYDDYDDGQTDGELPDYDDPYASTGEVSLSGLTGLDDQSDQESDQNAAVGEDQFETEVMESPYQADDPDPFERREDSMPTPDEDAQATGQSEGPLEGDSVDPLNLSEDSMPTPDEGESAGIDTDEGRESLVHTTADPDPSGEVVMGQLEPAFGDQTVATPESDLQQMADEMADQLEDPDLGEMSGAPQFGDDSASADEFGDEPVLGTLLEEDEEDEAMPEIGADSDEATQQVSAEFSMALDADAQMEDQLRDELEDELEHGLEEGLEDDLEDDLEDEEEAEEEAEEESAQEEETEEEEASVVVDGALVEAAEEAEAALAAASEDPVGSPPFSGLAADGDWASAAAAWAESGFQSDSMPSFIKSEPPPADGADETESELDQRAPAERTAPLGETLDSLRAKGLPAGASADSVEVSDADILMLDDDEIEQLEDEAVSTQDPAAQESWAQRATRDVDHGEEKQAPVQPGLVPRRSALYSKLTSPPMLAAALGLTVLVIIGVLWILLGSAEEVDGIAFPTEGLKSTPIEAPQPRAYRAKESATKLYGLGNRAAYLGQFEEAIKKFQEASRADPGFPHPHRAMGAIYAVLGRNELAAVSYETYLLLEPKGPDAAYVTKILREASTK